jgi:hypothetical protein
MVAASVRRAPLVSRVMPVGVLVASAMKGWPMLKGCVVPPVHMRPARSSAPLLLVEGAWLNATSPLGEAVLTRAVPRVSVGTGLRVRAWAVSPMCWPITAIV